MVRVQARRLREAVTRLRYIDNRWARLPVLRCARLGTVERDGRTVLLMEATDLEVYAEIAVPCTGTLEPVLLNIADLFSLPNYGWLVIKHHPVAGAAGEVSVVGEETTQYMVPVPVEDWPSYTLGTSESPVMIRQDEAAGLFRLSDTMASTDGSRHIINGVYFDGDRVVATDTHRLGIMPLTNGVPTPMIVSRDGLKVVEKIWKREPCSIVMHPGVSVRLDLGPNTRIGVRVIEGQFPNYLRIVSEQPPVVSTLKVAREDALSAAKALALVARSNEGRTQINVEDGELVFRTSDNHGRMVEAATPCYEVSGWDEIGQVALCQWYLADIFQWLREPEVTLGFISSDKQIAFTAGDRQVILMPMQAQALVMPQSWSEARERMEAAG